MARRLPRPAPPATARAQPDKVPPDELEQIGRGFDAEDAEDAASVAPPEPEPTPDERHGRDEREDDDQADDVEPRRVPSKTRLKMAKGIAHGIWSAINAMMLKGKRFECNDDELEELADSSTRLVESYLPDDFMLDGDVSPLTEALMGAAMVLGPKVKSAAPNKKQPQAATQPSASPSSSPASPPEVLQ